MTPACYTPRFMRRIRAAGACVLLLGMAACSRTPPGPAALPPPVTRLYEAPFDVVWDTVRVDLNNQPGLELDTIDKLGRFVAWERTNVLLLLLAHRDVVTVALEPVGPAATRMVLQMSAQRYDTGGWSRPADWYPSPRIDAERGLTIAASIDQRLGHAPSVADTVPLPPADAGAPVPAPDASAAAPTTPDTPPAPRTGWRRFLPRWPPFGRR